jgi:hypothetical protein
VFRGRCTRPRRVIEQTTKSGGVPAGGLGLDGKHTQRYISPSELEMMGN